MSWTDALNRLYRVQKEEKRELNNITEKNKKAEIQMVKTYSKIEKVYEPKPKPYTGWKPREWSLDENFKVQHLSTTPKKIDLENFKVYVSNTEYFNMNKQLPNFNTSSLKVDLKNKKDPYVNSLMAMYTLSYLGGMSLKNLESDNPLAKSLAHFYFFYHLTKFNKYRVFPDEDSLKPISELSWGNYEWHHHFVFNNNYTTDQIVDRWLGGDHDAYRNMRFTTKKVFYESRGKKRENIEEDYKKILLQSSNGVSHLGPRLLQESCQAYVYCVLGAQAKTRWKIVGDGVNSQETQQVFRKLVNEVISLNDLSKLLNSMRFAVSETKVRLDFVLSPGLELLPSDMVYIENSPGYNNTLLVASENQKFGSNANINSVKKKIIIPATNSPENAPSSKLHLATKQELKKPAFKTASKPESKPNETSNTEIITGAAILALVGRLAWLAIF